MPRHQITVNDETDAFIETYAAEHFITKQKAVAELVRTGFTVKHDNLYTSSLAQIVREEIRGEMAMFKRDVEDIAIELTGEMDLTLRDCIRDSDAVLLATIDSSFRRLPRDAKVELYRMAGLRMSLGDSAEKALEFACERVVRGSVAETIEEE